MKTIQTISLSLILAGLAVGCGQGTKDESGAEGDDDSQTVASVGGSTTTTTDESKPEDSTGATGNVALGFSSTTQTAGAALAEAGVEITMAKLNVAMVKLKPKKEATAKDQDIAAQESTEEKAQDAAVAEATGETEAAALAGNDGAANMSTEDRTAKLAAKKDELKKKDADRRAKEKARDPAIRFGGPFVFDALAGKLEGSAESAALPDGSYRRIEFKVRRTFDVVESDPLFGNAAIVKGTFTKDGAAVPFTIEIRNAMNFSLAGEKALAIVPSADTSLGLSFDLTKWLEGVDFSVAEIDTASGEVLIDVQHNQTLLKKVRSNMKTASRFGKDADGDGKIATDEAAGEGQATAE